MANTAEEIKTRYGNPFEVRRALERAATQGYEQLSEDDLFMCKWLGLYPHRHEPEYFMLRTKQPNGFVTPEQLDTVAQIAEQKNKGYVDITTRQDFQLHWVHYTQAAAILQQLEAVGISSTGACGDVARNVVGCPVAGVDRTEVLDGGGLVQQVSDFFLGNAAYANLPRKFKISIAGCREQCVHPEIQCVALVGLARQAGGATEAGTAPKAWSPKEVPETAGFRPTEAGFDVRVGGGLSTQPFISQRMRVFVTPEEALEVIRHIVDIWRDSPEYREKRHRARLKFLIHDWGVEKFRQVLEERLGRRLADAPAEAQDSDDTYRDHVGVHAQQQAGRYYVGAPVLVGRISSQQMRKVADLCRRYGDGNTIRLTNRQNILLLNISEAQVEKVLAGLSDVGLSINAHPVRRSVVTCTGTEFCRLAITETKARSRQIVEYLERRVTLDEPLRLHITGCPNACAQYQVAHIGLMGSKTKVDGQVVDAYDILIGGQLGQAAAFNHALVRKVPASECARRLERLLMAFTRQRKSGEAFNAWCRRTGDGALVRLLTEEEEHPLADAEDVPAPQAPEAGSQTS